MPAELCQCGWSSRYIDVQLQVERQLCSKKGKDGPDHRLRTSKAGISKALAETCVRLIWDSLETCTSHARANSARILTHAMLHSPTRLLACAPRSTWVISLC
mmetsp:Transcript_1697/g.10444  ORF Transcript_1697/g.10444 Transcript_1697/m.10444 type:complete len:102 (-) Transcript_1697:742-1047(-)